MQKENLILVVIGFADTVALTLYMSQSIIYAYIPNVKDSRLKILSEYLSR